MYLKPLRWRGAWECGSEGQTLRKWLIVSTTDRRVAWKVFGS